MIYENVRINGKFEVRMKWDNPILPSLWLTFVSARRGSGVHDKCYNGQHKNFLKLYPVARITPLLTSAFFVVGQQNSAKSVCLTKTLIIVD